MRCGWIFEMPLFGNKFSPKKTPQRKNLHNTNPEQQLDELVSTDRSISLKLGNQECTFQDGDWILESGANGNLHKINQKLHNRVQELEEENNMLRLKYEVLLNMLVQTTAESHIQEREIEKLKRLEKAKHKF